MLFAVASPSELRRVLARGILGFCLMHFLGSLVVPKCLPPASSLSSERGTPVLFPCPSYVLGLILLYIPSPYRFLLVLGL